MAYSELVKNFNKIRDYMREFYVYGFKSRDEYTKKSARSYDDERRRMESWLGDYMRFRQTPDGKNVFISIDSRVSRHNPLYKAWKTKSFTDGDITLHFVLFDILSSPDVSLSLNEITDKIDDYLCDFAEPKVFDESTVRKKLKEYLPDGKYVEQLGYETVRKSPTPPWQSSVRPLSQQAYDYIISAAGIQQEAESQTSVEALKEQLKTHIRAFYLDNDNNSVIEIRDTANKIIRAMNIAEKAADATNETYTPVAEASEKLQHFFEYCETTRLTYSYKPVLILAFLKCADKNGIMKLDKGIKWVRQYYEDRKLQGKKPEIKKCIYLNDSVTDEEIRNNLISNPIKALSESGYFFFNNEDQSLILSQEIWPHLGRSEKLRINKICLMRLQKYFNDN